MMHWIRVRNAYYAVNPNLEGLFVRMKWDSVYSQLLGTTQFSAVTPEDLEHYLREIGQIEESDVVEAVSW